MLAFVRNKILCSSGMFSAIWHWMLPWNLECQMLNVKRLLALRQRLHTSAFELFLAVRCIIGTLLLQKK